MQIEISITKLKKKVGRCTDFLFCFEFKTTHSLIGTSTLVYKSFEFATPNSTPASED